MTRATFTVPPIAPPSSRPDHDQGLGHREPSLVERLAGDDPRQAGDGTQRTTSSSVATPAADAITGTDEAAATSAKPSTSGPSSVPSRLMSVMTNASQPGSSRAGPSGAAHVASVQPLHRDVTPRDDRGRRPRAATAATARPRRTSLRRPTPSRPAPRRRRPGPRVRNGAHAATRSARPPGRRPPPRPTPRRDGSAGSPVACRVEVDDVDPARARRRRTKPPAPRDRRRTRSPARSRPARAGPHDRRAGRSPGRAPSADGSRRPRARVKLASKRSPSPLDFSGWNCVATTLSSRNTTLRIVPYSHVAATTPASEGTPCNECTKYIHGEAPSPANIGSSGRDTCSWFHCICGRFTPARDPADPPRDDAETRDLRIFVGRPNNICMPTQIPRKGRPDATASRTGSSSPARRRAAMHRPNAPTPGSTTASASRMRPTSAVRRASAPTCLSAFSAERRLPMP